MSQYIAQYLKHTLSKRNTTATDHFVNWICYCKDINTYQVFYSLNYSKTTVFIILQCSLTKQVVLN